MQEQLITIRPVRPNDRTAVLALEQRIWSKAGIVSLSEEMFNRWLATYAEGFLVALDRGTICGYVYNELIHFDKHIINTPQWSQFVREYYAHSHHNPSGNALFGVSLVTDPPNMGIGKKLLKATENLVILHDFRFWITIARMPGLADYINDARNNGFAMTSDGALAQYYGIQNMSLIGIPVHGNLVSITLPDNVPIPHRTDPVIARLGKVTGMELYDIVPSAFDDPESANYAGLLIRRM